jgi:hypothetical protein
MEKRRKLQPPRPCLGAFTSMREREKTFLDCHGFEFKDFLYSIFFTENLFKIGLQVMEQVFQFELDCCSIFWRNTYKVPWRD